MTSSFKHFETDEALHSMQTVKGYQKCPRTCKYHHIQTFRKIIDRSQLQAKMVWENQHGVHIAETEGLRTENGQPN